ncbi:hypothetical protein TVAG_478900 [Trichomonas vaginalis G3]|uniref:Right handed beta helix domain-containing protein n=1 Tax=Trichomonas vaginalis (strain ATCC PRA-98 / G3) TaxID=412133 RepID=A2E006_TRIV3|nr:hypothetical protein TVAGG3_0535930 [Trichomonas vaginalis G3]EAY14065.1 hypothetical protein TVAG_478900 [Trichomonas vaginalis G3]KAI5519494.1 hypothetical protein TVAGG3_0535930 [Trichomonas vaginalis G3]|eukprot:XP_001326288.1 hypothetical protein [Trichomonas vaginalis G3]
MNLKFDLNWDEFYSEQNDSYYSGSFSSSHSYYIVEITSTQNSRFIDFSNSDVSNIKILIESSLFHSNHIGYSETSNYYDGCGGNLFIYSKVDFVQNKTCSSNCSSSNFGQHCYIWIDAETDPFKNYNYLSSYSDLGQTGVGFSPICHNRGEVIIHNTNLSNCRTNQYCGILIELPRFPGNISQSSFTNNSATSKNCIYFTGYESFSYIKTNFLNNSVSDQLFYTVNHDLTIKECIIKNNSAKNTFSSYSPYTIHIIHSFIETSGSTTSINTELSSTQEFENIFSVYLSSECCCKYINAEDGKFNCVKALITLSNCISSSSFEQSIAEAFAT